MAILISALLAVEAIENGRGDRRGAKARIENGRVTVEALRRELKDIFYYTICSSS